MYSAFALETLESFETEQFFLLLVLWSLNDEPSSFFSLGPQPSLICHLFVGFHQPIDLFHCGKHILRLST